MILSDEHKAGENSRKAAYENEFSHCLVEHGVKIRRKANKINVAAAIELARAYGAIHMERGNYTLGQEWYAKAVERGATVDSVDRDIRKIYRQLGHDERAAMKSFLLNEDPVRYKWLQ